MKAVLPGCRRAAVSREGLEIEGEFRGLSATRIFSHDTDHSVYKVKGGTLAATRADNIRTPPAAYEAQ